MAQSGARSLPPLALPRSVLSVAGLFLGAGSVIAAGQGGWKPAVVAGFLGALALLCLLRPALRTDTTLLGALVLDALVIAFYAGLCDPGLVLWQGARNWGELFRMSPAGAGFAVGLYLVVTGLVGLTSRQRPSLAATCATIAIPFVFCLFLALGSDLPAALGSMLTLHAPLPAGIPGAVGAFLDVFLINEAVIWGAAVALGRRRPLDLRLHAVLAAAALFAAATPLCATLGSSAVVGQLPVPFQAIAMALSAAAAQAGLWAETYLVTQAIADLVRGVPPIAPRIRAPWRTGMRKGAVYGLVFMGLVAGAGVLVAWPPFLQWLSAAELIGACFLGAALFPLARTIMESTDTTPPFLHRLKAEAGRPDNYLRGFVAGGAVGAAFLFDIPRESGLDRFLFGVVWGVGASAGVDLATALVLLTTRSRRRLPSWRVFLVAAACGAAIGGAGAWYFDAGQLAVIRDKFVAYTTAHYAVAGRPVQPMTIYPLFSKWGMTNLGVVEGGVKLFYLESVSGVIQWIFAAPLFSINLFFLTAIVKRDLSPLRTLVSEEGVRLLVDNAIMVLRWGLWMAPVIYTFLKAAPDPQWYNQDGAVRTAVATLMASSLPAPAFAKWSLDVFTALLAFDWLRVMIWFDHMGLRVATLVNLSFVGGDVLDEKAAKFLGKAQKSRALPDGIRRFGTWAPLLLPFYIPRGAQWDQAWSAAERMRAATPPLAGVLMGYTGAAALGVAVLAALFMRRLFEGRVRLPGTGLPGEAGAKPFILTNGRLTSEWYDDGQGVTRVESAARGGPPVELTRGPDDPYQPRGKFIFLREGEGELWSLGAAPTLPEGDETTFQRLSPTRLFLSHQRNGLRIEATIEVLDGKPVEMTRLKLINLQNHARRVRVTTYREWVLNEPAVERRDPAYNAIHVGTWFLRDLGAILAQNRLLKAGGRLSPEMAFHAGGQGETGDVRLVAYEDVKSRFLGLSPVGAPDQVIGREAGRDPEDEGLLFGFEPCAALHFEARLAPESTAEIVLVDGWAPNFAEACASIARWLDRPAPDSHALAEKAGRRRSLTLPSFGGAPGFAFAADGRTLDVSPCTPRPYAHVLANALGFGAVLTADGDMFTFAGNARQNAMTPFRMGEGRAGRAGQVVYLRDLASGEISSATWLSLRRTDAAYDVTFGLGEVTYRSRCGDLEVEQTVFVPPDEPLQITLVALRNLGRQDRLYLVAPVSEIVLAELAADSRGAIETQADPAGRALFFRNPRNAFVQGWAFATTSFDPDFTETARHRCFGDRARGLGIPYFVQHGHPDARRATTERVAAFCGTVEVCAGCETVVGVALGQAASLEQAKQLAIQASDLAWAQGKREETRAFWNDMLGRLRIETNRPDFDRLVNDWLPYQLLTARLWGRTGPTQRSGATGYRDQLQDVLPLVFIAPDLARRQILRHARRQFVEGDAVKWWHRAPGGGTGLADRTHASDPHLWLPHVTLIYVAATGDEAVLDVETAFIEADPVPPDAEGRASVPLPSRESASLLDHCWRAVEYSLARFGSHGLPLMGTGDWDDGMNLIGAKGRGESVWLGFFLHRILWDFIPVLQKRGRHAAAATCRDRAAALAQALDACWRGDRYIRAYADDGKEVAPMSAMTAAWPALSGAVPHARGIEAVDKALALLARPDRVLLVTPPYDEHSDPYPGRSAEYPPGVRENGGQYSHGVSWFVDALARLSDEAADRGREDEAVAIRSRAFETWCAISPLTKFDTPEAADWYGLPPHQQAADVYEGPGYTGRGGWSWYTGSAARMLSAAYSMLGLRMENGEFSVRDDAFAPRGELVLKRVFWRGEVFASAEDV